MYNKFEENLTGTQLQLQPYKPLPRLNTQLIKIKMYTNVTGRTTEKRINFNNRVRRKRGMRSFENRMSYIQSN